MTIAEQSEDAMRQSPPRLLCDPLLKHWGEAMMSGKYSAEWWKKFSSMDRERSDRQDRPNLIEDLIHATAATGKCAGVKAETSRSMPPVVSQFSMADQQDTH
jgi:hypothetical protein